VDTGVRAYASAVGDVVIGEVGAVVARVRGADDALFVADPARCPVPPMTDVQPASRAAAATAASRATAERDLTAPP
jgi:hypothetical protein